MHNRWKFIAVAVLILNFIVLTFCIEDKELQQTLETTVMASAQQKTPSGTDAGDVTSSGDVPADVVEAV